MFNRLRTLRSRHHELDERIEDELKRPVPDTMQLQELKRAKLGLKDKIYSMQKTRMRRRWRTKRRLSAA